MTVRLVRDVAKELAGTFYEENRRSPEFRRAFPTPRSYLSGMRHRPDGTIKMVDPGWFHFVDSAKGVLATSLRDKTMEEYQKDRIMEQLIENAQRGSHHKAKRVLQTHTGHREADEK